MRGPGLSKRIDAFCKLGEILLDAGRDNPPCKQSVVLRERALDQIKANIWFTKKNVLKSITALGRQLKKQSLSGWLESYQLPENNDSPKKIGVIMAGNIPIVSFHDFLSVLITGNILVGKKSSKDSELIELIASMLIEIEPAFKELISFDENKLQECDAIIATGSNNSARYFEYHHGSKSHIFRKNRNSVAVITSETTDKELVDLGNDVFDYFGLGCRNVSKLYIPEGFNFDRLGHLWSDHSSLTEHKSYFSNYRYNKALYLASNSDFIDMKFGLLKKSEGFSSPIGVIYYSYYNNIREVKSKLLLNTDMIQTIVGEGYTPFGLAQSPALYDYADGVDTIDFLQNL